MLVVRKEGKAHDRYNSFRSAFELLEVVDRQPHDGFEEKPEDMPPLQRLEQRMQEQVSALTKQIDGLTTQNKALANQNEALANQNEALTTRMDSLTTQNKDLLLKMHNMDQEVRQLKMIMMQTTKQLE